MSNPMVSEDTAVQAGPAARTRAEREALKLEKRLCRQVGQAIADFNMIEAGDLFYIESF